MKKYTPHEPFILLKLCYKFILSFILVFIIYSSLGFIAVLILRFFSFIPN